MPRRIHCPRGQKKPDNTVLVRRPYRYGNPFDWREHGRELATELHAAWVINPASQPIKCGKVTYYPATEVEIVADLAGKDIGCNCPEDGLPCHGDTLLAIAACDKAVSP